MREYIKYILGAATIGAISSAITYKIIKKPTITPPSQPIIIEWEVDKEYNEKHTTLQNGVILTVAQLDKKDPKWEWNISGVAPEERAAIETVFKLGGVK